MTARLGDSWLSAMIIVAQWCLPSRRQHASRFESASDARIAGLISEKLNSSKSAMAEKRRIAFSVLLETLRILVWLLFRSAGSLSGMETSSR